MSVDNFFLSWKYTAILSNRSLLSVAVWPQCFLANGLVVRGLSHVTLIDSRTLGVRSFYAYTTPCRLEFSWAMTVFPWASNAWHNIGTKILLTVGYYSPDVTSQRTWNLQQHRCENFKSRIPPWSAAAHRRVWEHGGTEIPDGSVVRSELSLGYLQGNKGCIFPACVHKHEAFPCIVHVVSYRFSFLHSHRIFLGDSSSLCLQYNKKCKYIQSKHNFILQIQPATCFFYWFYPL
jgi:hypothetical protein